MRDSGPKPGLKQGPCKGPRTVKYRLTCLNGQRRPHPCVTHCSASMRGQARNLSCSCLHQPWYATNGCGGESLVGVRNHLKNIWR